MKNFIVLSAILPLLLIFLVQFTLDQKNSANIGRFQEYVYAAKEQAKQEGYFTEEIRKELRENIADTFGIKEEEIVIVAEATPQYRVNAYGGASSGRARGMIYYKVGAPINQLMAGRRLFGIREEDNKGMYMIESYTASERLP